MIRADTKPGRAGTAQNHYHHPCYSVPDTALILRIPIAAVRIGEISALRKLRKHLEKYNNRRFISA